jgi:hypothetical protein
MKRKEALWCAAGTSILGGSPKLVGSKNSPKLVGFPLNW